jgi:hypothetical protein
VKRVRWCAAFSANNHPSHRGVGIFLRQFWHAFFRAFLYPIKDLFVSQVKALPIAYDKARKSA